MDHLDRPAKLTPRVFIAHSSPDKPAARELYHRLKSDGFLPWLDEEQLLPGQNWQTEIRKAIRQSHVVLVCVSSKAVTRAGFFHKELKYALDIAGEQPEDAIFIVPVRLEDCEVPESLRPWQWLDIFKSESYERLKIALKIRLQYLESALPSRTSPDPDEPPDSKSGSGFESHLLKSDEGGNDAAKEVGRSYGTGASNRQNRENPLEGAYFVTGVNDNGTKYRGTAVIKSQGDELFMVTRVGRDTFISKGSQKKSALAMKGDFDVVYSIHKDGSLEGGWGDRGIEKLIPQTGGAAKAGGRV